MIIKNSQFVISVAQKENLYNTGNSPEVAVAGKSNVGKSSFINYFTGYGKLAKTSKEPGRTRLINYFSVNNGEFFLTDLPGYGFARVSDEEKLKWASLVEGYLNESKNLKCVLLLADIRHEPTDDDKLMVNYLYAKQLPFILVASKADKLSRSEVNKRITELAASFRVGVSDIYPVSSLKKTGKERLIERLSELLHAKEETEE